MRKQTTKTTTAELRINRVNPVTNEPYEETLPPGPFYNPEYILRRNAMLMDACVVAERLAGPKDSDLWAQRFTSALSKTMDRMAEPLHKEFAKK